MASIGPDFAKKHAWEQAVTDWLSAEDGLGAHSCRYTPGVKAWAAIVDGMPGVYPKLRQRGRVVKAWLDIRQSMAGYTSEPL